MEFNNTPFLIKNGTHCIFNALNFVCDHIKNQNVHLKAVENNMSKLITVVEILKRNLKDSLNFKYNIGIDNHLNYIECFLSIEHFSDNINTILSNMTNYNYSNNRKLLPNTLMECDNNKDDNNKNNIEDLCFDNVNKYFG